MRDSVGCGVRRDRGAAHADGGVEDGWQTAVGRATPAVPRARSAKAGVSPVGSPRVYPFAESRRGIPACHVPADKQERCRVKPVIEGQTRMSALPIFDESLFHEPLRSMLSAFGAYFECNPPDSVRIFLAGPAQALEDSCRPRAKPVPKIAKNGRRRRHASCIDRCSERRGSNEGTPRTAGWHTLPVRFHLPRGLARHRTTLPGRPMTTLRPMVRARAQWWKGPSERTPRLAGPQWSLPRCPENPRSGRETRGRSPGRSACRTCGR